jgi:hypothetical protein
VGRLPGAPDQPLSSGTAARSPSRRPQRSAIARLDDQDQLLGSLEEAINSARRLKMRDLEYILKMAVMEVLRHQAPLQDGTAVSGTGAAPAPDEGP